MWSLYIIQSEKNGRFYTGYTNRLTQRLLEHNQGQTTSTRAGRPWKLVHQEYFESKSDAAARERQIKSWKSRRSIQELIAAKEVEHPGAPGGS